MGSEKKTTYTYGGATIHITSQYGNQNFDEIVEQVIIQKVLEDFEKTDN